MKIPPIFCWIGIYQITADTQAITSRELTTALENLKTASASVTEENVLSLSGSPSGLHGQNLLCPGGHRRPPPGRTAFRARRPLPKRGHDRIRARHGPALPGHRPRCPHGVRKRRKRTAVPAALRHDFLSL